MHTVISQDWLEYWIAAQLVKYHLPVQSLRLTAQLASLQYVKEGVIIITKVAVICLIASFCTDSTQNIVLSKFGNFFVQE